MATVEISENTIGYEAAGDRSQPDVPVVIYSLSFDAEQLLTAYGALTTYLKILCQQESQDFKMIERATKILIEIQPRAVEASKSLALKAVGTKP